MGTNCAILKFVFIHILSFIPYCLAVWGDLFSGIPDTYFLPLFKQFSYLYYKTGSISKEADLITFKTALEIQHSISKVCDISCFRQNVLIFDMHITCTGRDKSPL